MAEKKLPQNPFTELLEWGLKQPLWQQETIRRILQTNTSLSATSIEQLADLCLSEQSGALATVTKLTSSDFPAGSAAAQSIKLTGFGNAQNVNALKSDQWINIGPALTVIFGNNASGKSGYGRILKKAFKARIVEDLQPNVRAEKLIPDAPGATFEFQSGTAPANKHVWNIDKPLAPDVASRFAVLDSKCGQAYVVNNELQVAPQGLDVLPRFVAALDSVRAQIQQRRFAYSATKSFLDGINLNSPTAAFVSTIGATTDFEKVRDRISFDSDAEARLANARIELAQLQAQSPQQLINQLNAGSKAAKNLVSTLEKRSLLTNKAAIDRITEARTRVALATDAAKKVTTLTADKKIEKSVGNEPWLALIEAAAEFVGAANDPSKGLLLEGDKCALCLETASPAAKDRLARFWTFVNDTATEQKTVAEKLLATHLAELKLISSPTDEQTTHLANLLAQFDEELPSVVDELIAESAATANLLIKNKQAKPPNYDDAIKRLNKTATQLAAKATKMSSTDSTIKDMSALTKEIGDLEARQTLSARQEAIKKFLTDVRKINLLDATAASIKTLAATKKSTELNERYVTDSYRTGVSSELKRIGFSRPVPVLVQQGNKGKVRILTLANSKFQNVTAEQVFSEGERTAIAIASFFSELSFSSSNVGLIFDDPISSLDNSIRERVAERLVDEGPKRQVIVFTHDLVFLTELVRIAKEKAVQLDTCELSSTSSVVGVVSPVPPWDAMKVADRTNALGELLKQADKHDKAGNVDELNRTLHRFIGQLRSTWERFIEEKLFNGTLERFNRHIKVNNLNTLHFDQALAAEIVHRINEVSGFIEAHDHSAAMNTPPLTLAQASALLEHLKDARKKHGALGKTSPP